MTDLTSVALQGKCISFGEVEITLTKEAHDERSMEKEPDVCRTMHYLQRKTGQTRSENSLGLLPSTDLHDLQEGRRKTNGLRGHVQEYDLGVYPDNRQAIWRP